MCRVPSPSAPKTWAGKCQCRGQSTHIPVLPPHCTGMAAAVPRETLHTHLSPHWAPSSGVSPEPPKPWPRSLDLKTSERGWQESWCATCALGTLRLRAQTQAQRGVTRWRWIPSILCKIAKRFLKREPGKGKKKEQKLHYTVICHFSNNIVSFSLRTEVPT